MCRDIVAFRGSWSVLAAGPGVGSPWWVQDEIAQELAGFGVDDADVEVGDQQEGSAAGVFAARRDVAQLGVVAQGHHAEAVGAVPADAIVRVQPRTGGPGGGTGGVGLGWGSSSDRAVAADG
ncbi:MAG TPA: hypothetical protein VI110_08985, partial [Lapillicoccus sp.]